MIKKTSRYFFSSPDEIGYNNYLILIFSLMIVVIGSIGTITNVVLGLGWLTIASTAVPTLAFLPVYLYSRITRRYFVTKYVLIIMSLGLLNFQWFINYGTKGPLIFFFVILESFILLFLKNRAQILGTIILFVNLTALFIIEYTYPVLLSDYPNEFARLFDLYMGMLVYLIISVFFVKITIRFYIREREKAQLSDKLKSAFLANMSHEIRTPMNGILGFVNLLKKPDISEDQQQEFVEIIEQSGQRMLTIINDIIDISKIEAGLMQINTKQFCVNEQIQNIYTFFKPEAEAKGLDLLSKKALSTHQSLIETDSDKVYAVLTNLVKNAIKYTHEGSIEFGYELRNGSGLKELEFYVKDTGIGIPRDNHQTVFERFRRTDLVEKNAYQGAGLGLSISKAYVEMLGGKIWVNSEEGKGSSFYFTLPYSFVNTEKNAVYDKVVSEKENIEVVKLKILIAEDDETSRMLISLFVKDFSKETILAKNGREAVELCHNHPDIDLILMDIKMNQMDGYEATRKIREFNRNVIIIAQTAFAQNGDKEKIIEAGCNNYVSKPINFDKLLFMIKDYFNI